MNILRWRYVPPILVSFVQSAFSEPSWSRNHGPVVSDVSQDRDMIQSIKIEEPIEIVTLEEFGGVWKKIFKTAIPSGHPVTRNLIGKSRKWYHAANDKV